MTENRDVWKRTVRAILIGVAVFLFCLVAGSIAGWAMALATNYMFGGMGFNMQVRAPLAYKALMYCLSLYLPFLMLTVIVASLRRLPGRGLPASLAYLTYSGQLFANGMYHARGMQIESRPFYALVLFVPAVVIIALGRLVSRRSIPVIMREQQP